MTPSLENIVAAVDDSRDSMPPLEKWHPALSGDIDIRIASDGRWYHEGGEIKREKLVRLFASILRREDDGEHYLVTPVEKWRIAVDWLPLVIIASEERIDKNGLTVICFTTNTRRQAILNADNSFVMVENERGDTVPAIHVRNGLLAVLNRAVYYALAATAITDPASGRLGIVSGGCHHPLES